jgi:hypothetical protein
MKYKLFLGSMLIYSNAFATNFCAFTPTTLPVLKPITSVSATDLQNDYQQFLSDLSRCWANQNIHEQMDGFSLSDRITTLSSELPTDVSSEDVQTYALQLFSKLKPWTYELHDGHLGVSPPQGLTDYYYTGLNLIRVKEGIAISACNESAESSGRCTSLKLPTLISKIDGLDPSDWLSLASSESSGSNLSGREYNALKSLNFVGVIKADSSFPTTFPAQMLTLTNLDGTTQTYPLQWRSLPSGTVTSATPSPSPATERQCAHSNLLNGTWVLRITTFDCQDPSDQGTVAQMVQLANDRLIRQFTREMSGAPDFERILIDIRGNGGGAQLGANFLLEHFNDGPVTIWGGLVVPGSGNNTLAPYMLPSDPNPITFPHDADFKSKPLWILTDGGVFSSFYR